MASVNEIPGYLITKTLHPSHLFFLGLKTFPSSSFYTLQTYFLSSVGTSLVRAS